MVWVCSGNLVQQDGISYLELIDGYQYQGKFGEVDYWEVVFEKVCVCIGSECFSSCLFEVCGCFILDLIDDGGNEVMVELVWCWFLVFMVLIMCFVVVLLFRVNFC